MTYAQFELQLQTSLQTLYDIGEATLITNWVMDELTGTGRWQRRQKAHAEIEADKLAVFDDAKSQLLQYKPVQYVLGFTFFGGLKFLVNESVLIPRPETEELVEWIVNIYKNSTSPLQILDIGTGSGCIPIAIKKKLPSATITSIDISREALNLAEQNATINGVIIQFQEFDFLDELNWPQLGSYDLIVSNPPYIPVREKGAIDKNVTTWEPDLALFVPDENPLLFYKKIIAFGKINLVNNGAVLVEIHQDYANAVEELFSAAGYSAVVKKDIHGNNRMVKAFKPQ